jgi:hypothetical protein
VVVLELLLFSQHSGTILQEKTKMNITDITNAIISGNLSNKDLSACVNAIKFARNNLAKESKVKFPVGATVQFDGSKVGKGVIVGDVISTGRIYFKVKSGTTTYRVPANMLEGTE